MGGSLAAGIRRVRDEFPSASAALLCLADQPLLETARFVRMLARHAEKPGPILATQQSGVTGPPVLFPRDCFDELMPWSGGKGAQALIERESYRVERVPCDTGIDVDTPDDLARARSRIAANRLV